MKDWNKIASNLLKSELKRRDIDYDQLILLLKKNGIEETKASILNKLSRGTFQLSFFLQCCAAIGLKTLRLDDLFEEKISLE